MLEPGDEPLDVVEAGVEDGHVPLVLLAAGARDVVIVAHARPLGPWPTCLAAHFAVRCGKRRGGELMDVALRARIGLARRGRKNKLT